MCYESNCQLENALHFLAVGHPPYIVVNTGFRFSKLTSIRYSQLYSSFLLPNCCQFLNKYACNPHKYWVLFEKKSLHLNSRMFAPYYSCRFSGISDLHFVRIRLFFYDSQKFCTHFVLRQISPNHDYQGDHRGQKIQQTQKIIYHPIAGIFLPATSTPYEKYHIQSILPPHAGSQYTSARSAPIIPISRQVLS